jgi:trans-2,3-dihydro-3-hydroxyanthranilate isomerase
VPTFPFMQVDAFAGRPLAGNPCAVIFDADDLEPATMQAIAREMNLSETAFVLRSSVADVRARYFTPAEEIPLAGHPTIATVHALIETQRLRLNGDLTRFMLELQVGPIPVEVTASEGVVQQIIMSQKAPQFLATYPAGTIMPIFGLDPADALPGVPIQTVSTGTPQLMIPVRDREVLREVTIDQRRYEALRKEGDFFSTHLFALRGATDEGHTFARHFSTPPDLFEDPFTGSSTGGMAAFLWRYGLLEMPRFIAEQGHWMGRPGSAQVEVVGPPGDISTVRVGGRAVTIIRGALSL